MTKYTRPQCNKWLADKTTNPVTGRSIKANGPTYRAIQKQCYELGVVGGPSSKTKSKKMTVPKDTKLAKKMTVPQATKYAKQIGLEPTDNWRIYDKIYKKEYKLSGPNISVGKDGSINIVKAELLQDFGELGETGYVFGVKIVPGKYWSYRYIEGEGGHPDEEYPGGKFNL